MTLLVVCSKCGGEGRCYNCGTTHCFGFVDMKREQELLENHLRGAGQCRRRS